MIRELRANLWLLGLTCLICSVIYPAVLLGIATTVFHNNAEGSLIRDAQGKPIGSHLIAQPFTGEQYFQPRPSAAGYNGAASGATNWGANNYLLRDRVARILGPIVKYHSGSRKGQLVAADIEKWFGQDQFDGKAGIVSQWAQAHSTLATNWVKADPMNAADVTTWMQANPELISQWKTEHPDTSDPKPEDLAVAFFTDFSKQHPGKFPIAAEHTSTDGKAESSIEPLGEGSVIQSIFFDMWRQEHPDANLEPVPADMVMASGSGLDPHITLKNAQFQLDRVSAKWAESTGRTADDVRKEIEKLLHQKASAPLGGLAGVEIVNVLEVNLALNELFKR